MSHRYTLCLIKKNIKSKKKLIDQSKNCVLRLHKKKTKLSWNTIHIRITYHKHAIRDYKTFMHFPFAKYFQIFFRNRLSIFFISNLKNAFLMSCEAGSSIILPVDGGYPRTLPRLLATWRHSLQIYEDKFYFIKPTL